MQERIIVENISMSYALFYVKKKKKKGNVWLVLFEDSIKV